MITKLLNDPIFTDSMLERRRQVQPCSSLLETAISFPQTLCDKACQKLASATVRIGASLLRYTPLPAHCEQAAHRQAQRCVDKVSTALVGCLPPPALAAAKATHEVAHGTASWLGNFAGSLIQGICTYVPLAETCLSSVGIPTQREDYVALAHEQCSRLEERALALPKEQLQQKLAVLFQSIAASAATATSETLLDAVYHALLYSLATRCVSSALLGSYSTCASALNYGTYALLLYTYAPTLYKCARCIRTSLHSYRAQQRVTKLLADPRVMGKLFTSLSEGERQAILNILSTVLLELEPRVLEVVIDRPELLNQALEEIASFLRSSP